MLQLDQEDEQQGAQEVDQGNDARGQVLEQEKQRLLQKAGKREGETGYVSVCM